MAIEARAEHTERSDVHAGTHHPQTVREWLGEAITDLLLLVVVRRTMMPCLTSTTPGEVDAVVFLPTASFSNPLIRLVQPNMFLISRSHQPM
jgi:hypothetical protein